MEAPPLGVKERQRQATESRILDAAATIFSEVGFAGARVDAIAERAGVNKATIYYHIGNKEALYGRVLHDVFGRLTESMADEIHHAKSPEEKLKAYIRCLQETMKSNPHMPAIMMREMAAEGRNFPEIAVRDLTQMISMLSEIMMEGEKKGIFVKTFPPLIHFMVVGATLFFGNVRIIAERYAKLADMQRLAQLFPADPPGELEKLLFRAVMKN